MQKRYGDKSHHMHPKNYDYYSADITRTFPVNGRFTDAQREVYEVVLRAQLASIDADVGAVFFGAVVVLTLLAARSFDPRLIWDRMEEGHV